MDAPFPKQLLGAANEADVVVNGVICRSLLDTGSTVSTVSKRFYDKHLGGVELHPLGEMLDIEGAGGHKLPYLGYVQVSLRMAASDSTNTAQQECLFLVVHDTRYNSNVPVLLGTNVLCPLMSELQSYHGVRFQQTAGLTTSWQLAFKSIAFQRRHLDRSKGKLAEVRSLQDRNISLPGNSSLTVWGEVKKDLAYHPCWVVQQRAQNSFLYGVDIAPILLLYEPSQEKMVVPVRVSNLSASIVNISPAEIIAELHVCEPVEVGSPDPVEAGELHTESCDNFLSMFDFTGTAVSGSEKQRLLSFLCQWREVFSHSDLDIGLVGAVKHHIKLSDNVPFKQRTRRIPPAMLKEVKEHLEQLMAAGVIRRSHSPFSSNMVLVRKSDNSLRLCIDYRQLNSRTIKDSYALPRIEELLDSLVGAQLFSVLDMKSGYHQVEIAEQDKEKTAFTAGPLGFYEYNRMPFGLSNSPATYQRLMEDCLRNLNHDVCYIYLDDVIIVSSSFDEHIDRLEKVFNRFKKCGLKLSPKKCKFVQSQVKYVGHVVSSNGVSPDPAKIEKIQTWPSPKNVDELRSFLGFSGYYRKHVEGYSSIAQPLTSLLGGTRKSAGKNSSGPVVKSWVWGEEQERAFQALKDKLTTPPVLAYPDFTLPFILHVDASRSGLGGVLYQEQDGVKRVIAYASRGLSKVERNYSTHKLEFLALKWAISQKFHDYLYGNTFTVYSDNNPLTYILTSAKLDATGHRWLAALSCYHFTIRYKSGLTNVDADALSRLPGLSDQPDKEISQEVIRAVCHKGSPVYAETLCWSMQHVGNEGDSMVGFSHRDWKKAQYEDPILGPLIYHMQRGGEFKLSSFPDPVEGKALVKQLGKMEFHNGVLYRKAIIQDEEWLQLVLPEKFREEAIRGVHDDVGHLGRDKALALLRERFYWYKMADDLEDWLKSCDRCLHRKSPMNTRAPLVSIETSEPLEMVCMDFLTLETSKGGFQNILVITDHFTRYAVAIPTKNQTAKTTAEVFFHGFVVHYGFPKKIHTDQGPNFESHLIKELCHLGGIAKSRTTPYHAMCNGQCEKFNHTLLDMLGTLDQQEKDNWKAHVAPLVLAYNCTRNGTTGVAPFYLMFGRHPRLPVDLAMGLEQPIRKYDNEYITSLQTRLKEAYKLASTKALASQRKQKNYYDLKTRGATLSVGDRVLVKVVAFEGKHKIADRWERGAYVVMRQPDESIPVFTVQREDGGGPMRTLHRNLLLPISSLPIPFERRGKRVKNLPTEETGVSEVQGFPERDMPSEDEQDIVVTVEPSPETSFTKPSGDKSLPGATGGTDEGESGSEASQEEQACGGSSPVDKTPTEKIEAPVNVPKPAPRRSLRKRHPPAWMTAGDYAFPQISFMSDNNSWTWADRTWLLKLLSAEGVFSRTPPQVAQELWSAIVKT